MARAKQKATTEAEGGAAGSRDPFGPGDIISVIRQIGPTLSRSEQRVATALLNRPLCAMSVDYPDPGNFRLARPARA